MMKIKLSWKLTSIFCLVIFFILSIVHFYINSHIKEYLGERIQYNLKRDLLLNKSLLENELKSSIDSSDTPALARRIGGSLDVRATIINASGVVKGDSKIIDKELHRVENHITRPEIQDALKHGFGESRRFSTTKKMEMLYMAVSLKGEKLLGFLRLSIPLSELDHVGSKIQKIIAAALLFGIMLTFVLGIVISTMISKPLSEMSSIAKNMAKGDFSKKVYIRSNDEVGDLGRSLNNMAEDIKNKMEKISYEETRIDAVISSMFEGILLTDEKGRILMINSSLRKLFVIDYVPEGKRPIELLRNNDIQDMVDTIIRDRKNISKEGKFSLFYEEKTILINGAPVIKEGLMQGVILVFHDITEIRRLETVRQDFVANVSHELRTPLANIKGYAETLLHGALEDTNNAKDFTNIIYRESDRLAKLIDDLLDLSKIESGRIDIVPAPFDISAILVNASEILKKPARDKNISIEISSPGDTPKVLADESRLTQVVLNLLDNAIKFTPENGRIKITTIKKDAFVQTDISDTGPGIPEKDLFRIFERFYRVDKSHSRDLGGTGLGLSIVKHIVQLHGGETWASSMLGNGSTFSFTIPAA